MFGEKNEPYDPMYVSKLLKKGKINEAKEYVSSYFIKLDNVYMIVACVIKDLRKIDLERSTRLMTN